MSYPPPDGLRQEISSPSLSLAHLVILRPSRINIYGYDVFNPADFTRYLSRFRGDTVIITPILGL